VIEAGESPSGRRACASAQRPAAEAAWTRRPISLGPLRRSSESSSSIRLLPTAPAAERWGRRRPHRRAGPRPFGGRDAAAVRFPGLCPEDLRGVRQVERRWAVPPPW